MITTLILFVIAYFCNAFYCAKRVKDKNEKLLKNIKNHDKTIN